MRPVRADDAAIALRSLCKACGGGDGGDGGDGARAHGSGELVDPDPDSEPGLQ